MKLNTLHAQLEHVLNGLRWMLDEDVEGWGRGNTKIPTRFTESVKPFFRFMVPYCIQEIAPGRYVVLNRGYKPLGIIGESMSTPIIDYIDYAVDGPAELPKFSTMYAPLNDRYLYNDVTVPWESRKLLNAYMARLEALIKALS
ncbi:hypothetical protein [Enterobacter mori]|uniref:hypothetical protein n=1 Tax=Enterobacter mori TaxID=539813 RepID=UPI0026E19019|nr:hypothetical protein [Enterobacter mori]WKW38375.1 hypothetical protein PZO51_02595 [Enterobacter mori]